MEFVGKKDGMAFSPRFAQGAPAFLVPLAPATKARTVMNGVWDQDHSFDIGDDCPGIWDHKSRDRDLHIFVGSVIRLVFAM